MAPAERMNRFRRLLCAHNDVCVCVCVCSQPTSVHSQLVVIISVHHALIYAVSTVPVVVFYRLHVCTIALLLHLCIHVSTRTSSTCRVQQELLGIVPLLATAPHHVVVQGLTGIRRRAPVRSNFALLY